jgi:hypothetical protein
MTRAPRRPRRPRRRPDPHLIYTGEADRLYRMRKCTAAKAYLAGLIPGRVTRVGILISAKAAEDLWGIK